MATSNPMSARTPQSDPESPESHGTDPSIRRSSSSVVIVVVFVLGIAWIWTFQGLIDHSPEGWVPRYASLELGTEATLNSHVLDTDQGFVAWLISRNARVWIESPSLLFDAGICHPTPQSLALGEPALTLGLLGVPVWWLTRDPLWTYNSVVWFLALFSAFAMFFVVRSWTGDAIAGGVAGLLYGFHSARLSDPTHLYVPDTVWTLLALFFFYRWLSQGRWRDVFAFGVSAALQIGGSLYPLVAGLALGLPFSLWSLWSLGFQRTRWAQWGVLAVFLTAVLYTAFAPALTLAAGGELSPRSFQVFLPWSTLWDDPERKLGFWLCALPLLAFWPQRSRPLGGLRWALLGGAGLALALATGGNVAARQLATLAGEPPPWALPNLYALLASILPGLDVVRLPASIAYGAFLALALLAGLGVAQALRRLPASVHGPVGWVLLAAVFLTTIRPGWAGDQVFAYRNLLPDPSEIVFYESLSSKGDTGPILELPMEPGLRSRDGLSILVSAYHERPTSACYNSFLPSQTEEVQALARQLPRDHAIQALQVLGFRTVIVHHDVYGKSSHAWLRELEKAARGSNPRLIRLQSDGERTAFRLSNLDPSVGRSGSIRASQ